MISDHIRRIRESLDKTTSLVNLASYIEKYTYLNGKRFSFLDHEFQRDILMDDSPESIVVKCAQIGLSEISARWTVAACNTQDNFTVIYTFPTTGDAEKFCRTRLDPCIASSPELQHGVNPNLNNAELKQFGANSFVYFRGTISATAALSVPADVVIHDEVDKSDLTQMSVYVSRLQHKPTKIRKLFSTPTVSKYGISAFADTARRMRQMWKCSHCNHYFAPDYFENVHIPGWTKDKREINKQNLKDVRWEEAQLLCPKCFQVPSFEPEYRSWVQENTKDNYPARAWFVTPFSAPKVLSAANLVKDSTSYAKYSEFMNQSLGLTAEDSEDSITETDLRRALIQADLRDSNLHYMGCDMGLMCHITIGRPADDGKILVVRRESVPYTKFEARRQELAMEYRVSVSVHDAQPYVELVTRITEYDANAYAAVFTTGTPSVMFSVKEQEEDDMEGRLTMRRLNITRTLAFDTLMAELKQQSIIIQRQETDVDEAWINQMQSLKRVQKLDRTGEIVYLWVKTDNQDHYHFSLLYMYLACRLRGTNIGFLQTGRVPILSSFRVKQRT